MRVIGTFCRFSADVPMPELVSHMRLFRRSVEAGSESSGGVGSAGLFRRLDAFLSSHIGK